METALTPTDVMLMSKHRTSGTAITGVALAAGLGALAIGSIWGVNQASKARSRAAEQLASANADTSRNLLSLIAAERGSREVWQNRNQPTIGQYVDVQTNPNLNATLQDYVSAMATAQATANAINNSPINSAVGTESFLKVQRYSAPMPCGCDTCNG